jgi:hypothetical protein
VEKSRNSLGDHWHVPSFASFIQVLSKSRTLQRIAIPLEDMHIIANPLLNEDRKECSKKTEDKGHEPENIYTDVRCRWIEHRERRWWGGRDGNLWGDGG